MNFNELEAFVKGQQGDEITQLPEEILEKVWYLDTFNHPIDNESTHTKITELEELLQSLSRKRKSRVIRGMLDLCVEHEREAYLAGVRLGAKLMIEILNVEGEQQSQNHNSEMHENVFIGKKISTSHI